jgi:hypothetical protein
LNAQQTAQAIFDLYTTLGDLPTNDLPIGIYRVNNPELPQCTYLILLSGTQFNWNQANNLITDIYSSPGLLNEYFVDIEDAIYQYIPTGATLIIAGHSLGGMEAQNIAANPRIRTIYHVARVITYGSPQTVTDVPPTSYQRFATHPDPVPLLALKTFTGAPHFCWLLNPNERKQESEMLYGQYLAHLSYPQLPELVYFDALGNPRAGSDRHISPCTGREDEPLSGQTGWTELQLGGGRRLKAPGFLLP